MGLRQSSNIRLLKRGDDIAPPLENLSPPAEAKKSTKRKKSDAVAAIEALTASSVNPAVAAAALANTMTKNKTMASAPASASSYFGNLASYTSQDAEDFTRKVENSFPLFGKMLGEFSDLATKMNKRESDNPFSFRSDRSYLLEPPGGFLNGAYRQAIVSKKFKMLTLIQEKRFLGAHLGGMMDRGRKLDFIVIGRPDATQISALGSALEHALPEDATYTERAALIPQLAQELQESMDKFLRD
jgi:hypothetical protein